MSVTRVISPFLFVMATGFAVAATTAQAKIVENDLTGNVQFDGWDDLGLLPGLGFNDVGPDVNGPAPPNPSAFWPAPLGSFEAGSGDAELNRTFGTHYSASFSLYTFAGPSGFTIGDSSAISGLETVVFTILDWAGSSPTSPPLLSYTGAGGPLPADFTSSSPAGSVFFAGDTIPVSARTFQWDLTGLGAGDFNIDWTQGGSAGILAFQLEQSDTFSLASATVIPEPSSLLVALGAAAVSCFRRRR